MLDLNDLHDVMLFVPFPHCCIELMAVLQHLVSSSRVQCNAEHVSICDHQMDCYLLKWDDTTSIHCDDEI